MSSYLVQGGTNLYRMSASGDATLLTLPAGVTLYGASQPCRAALFAPSAIQPVLIVVNGANKDFYIDSLGTARIFGVSSPISAPNVAAGTGSGLTGVYTAGVTFKVKDALGATLFESGLSPLSTGSSSLANKTLAVTNIAVSGEAIVNARGLYRSVAGGSILYPWLDVDDNATTSIDLGGADATLSILPATATTYGTPPPLKLVTAWKNRLWGIPRGKVDAVRWTEDSSFFAWSTTNELLIPPLSGDLTGGTAFIPRRDQLGVARTDRLYQINGDSNDTFQRQQVSETIGCVSQESVVVIRDVAYFLGDKGVVEWSSQQIGYVSEAQVDGWFSSDDFFNRSLFSQAQGRYNRDTDSYELLLASAGSDILDVWIAFDLKRRCWFGPHTTSAFQPTCAGNATDKHGELHPALTSDPPVAHRCVFGASDGCLYMRDTTTALDAGTPVSFEVELPTLGGQDLDADLKKTWLEPTILTHAGSVADTLTVTATVIDDAGGGTSSFAQSHDLTQARTRLFRAGLGRLVKFVLSHLGPTTPRIYSFKIPYNIVGRR